MAIPSPEELDDEERSTLEDCFRRECVKVGDHWIWGGLMASGKRKEYPRFYAMVNGTMVDGSARKFAVLYLGDGADEAQTSVLCKRSHCVNPAHLKAHSEYSALSG